MNKEKSIDVLNTLIKINNDRIEGYQTATNETNEQDLKELFSQLSITSELFKSELNEEVNILGGTPAQGTKLSGKFFRVWMDIKTSIAGKDLHSILTLCEHGEDAAIDTYNEVLENESENLTIGQLLMIKKQYFLLKADHDKVKALRDNLVEHK